MIQRAPLAQSEVCELQFPSVYTGEMINERSKTLQQAMLQTGYVADKGLLVSLDLMQTLEKPLLLEGEAGVGKTGIATSLATATGLPLIRLQCYEGLDAQHVLYDWDYQRQLLAIQMLKSSTGAPGSGGNELPRFKETIYSEEFLLKRPLFQAISAPERVILLIDEVDRADEEFEALLLEVLAESQITVPELGTFKAATRPHVILTSNAVRELSDALRRRCLYHYIDYPDADKELSIVKARLPEIDQTLASEAVKLIQRLREQSLRKKPGIAETLDWLAALCSLDIKQLKDSPEAVDSTLSALLKTRADQKMVREELKSGTLLNPQPLDSQQEIQGDE